MAVALGGLAGSLVLTKPGLGRRLVAGEVSGGGAHRVSPTGDHLDGGLVLRIAGELPHPVVQAVRCGEAGNVGDDDNRDGRSSDLGENGVAAHGRSNG